MDIYPYKSRFSFPVVKCPPDASGEIQGNHYNIPGFCYHQ